MTILFYKYQGTGNDFIIIDGRKKTINFSDDQILKMCNRRYGIGADGLIILKDHEEADFVMDYYNADGTQSFCGNGSRCAQAFAQKLGIIGTESHFIAMLLLGNNIALVFFGLFSADLLGGVIVSWGITGEGITLLIQTVLSTALVLVTAEFLPKTFVQMIAILFLLIHQPLFVFSFNEINIMGRVLLFAATILTLWSGIKYLIAGLKTFDS